MSDISSTLATIKETAERVGLSHLAREAGVPYTTVKSFADRDWSHKNLDIIEKLAAAAERLSAAA